MLQDMRTQKYDSVIKLKKNSYIFIEKHKGDEIYEFLFFVEKIRIFYFELPFDLKLFDFSRT